MSQAARKLDPYEMLGVSKDADAAAIKRAFRRKAQHAHPDKGGTAESFADLSRANAVLSNDRLRARYDATGEMDDGADNLEQAALNLINSMLAQALQAESDPTKFDLMTGMKRAVELELDQAKAKMRPLMRARDRLERMRGRFTAKKGMERFERMLDWHGKQIAAQIANFERAVDERQRALDILSDHAYRFDAEDPPMARYFASTTAYQPFSP